MSMSLRGFLAWPFVPPAIPALQPIVHDLFVLRGTNKADAGKELETQKEVVVSMLLRLIQYHQVRSSHVGGHVLCCPQGRETPMASCLCQPGCSCWGCRERVPGQQSPCGKALFFQNEDQEQLIGSVDLFL